MLKALLYVLNVPLYWLSRLTPRCPTTWVFGAWFGDRYTDNSRHLFEHVAQHCPHIRAVWLTRDRGIRDALRERGLECELAHSARGYWISCRASIAFVVTSRWDINRFCYVPRCFNLWHGIPLKKIMADDTYHWSPESALLRRLVPFYGKSPGGEIIVSSPLERQIMSSAFQTPVEHIHVTGSPRNDVLEVGLRDADRPAVILYAPTHRGEGAKSSLGGLAEAAPELDRVLGALNAVLVVRAHYYQDEELDLSPYSHLMWYDDTGWDGDMNVGLRRAQVLITDYSSVYLDFLLTDRPIIFLPYDMQDYLGGDREMYFDYASVAPGPHCEDWRQVTAALVRSLKGQDEHADARREVRAQFHSHQDFAACARVVAVASAPAPAVQPRQHL